MGKRQGTLGKGVRLFQVTSQQMCLSQREATERLKADHFHSSALCYRLRHQWYGVGKAPARAYAAPSAAAILGKKIAMFASWQMPMARSSRVRLRRRSPWRRESSPTP